MMKRSVLFLALAVAFGLFSVDAQAANCQGRRDTGTAVGAIGGGILGNAASRGSAAGTIAGAIVGGVAGNVIGGSNCRSYRYGRFERRHHAPPPRYRAPPPRYAYYYDYDGRRHAYRR